MGTVRNPDLQDCINYMKAQVKNQERYPRSYEFTTPYYKKTVEYLKALKKMEEQSASGGENNNSRCGSWISLQWVDPRHADYKCSICGEIEEYMPNFCPNCGADLRPKILDEAVDGEGKYGNVKEGEQNENTSDRDRNR